jgi:hypothetical protein
MSRGVHAGAPRLRRAAQRCLAFGTVAAIGPQASKGLFSDGVLVLLLGDLSDL